MPSATVPTPEQTTGNPQTQAPSSPQAQAQAQPSTEIQPSPPPTPPPTAQTPGIRAQKFTDLYQATLKKTLSTLSYENFTLCFPTIAASAPASLKSLHGTFVTRLSTFATTEFEKILEERNVIANLNELEDLLRDAKRRRARAVDDGGDEAGAGGAAKKVAHEVGAEELVAAHLNRLLLHEQSVLNARIQNFQAENIRLAEAIAAQRGEIQALVEGLVGRVEDLNGAVGALQVVAGDADFRSAVRELDAEVSMV